MVADLPLVLDVGMVLRVLIHVVVDDLGAAVGQEDLVLALDGLSVTLLVLGVHIGVAVLVVAVHIIAVSVRSIRIVLLLMVGGGLVVSRSRLVVGGGRGRYMVGRGLVVGRGRGV